MDSEDEAWLDSQNKKIELTSNKFEEMIDRLEKGSGQQVGLLHIYRSLRLLNYSGGVLLAKSPNK